MLNLNSTWKAEGPKNLLNFTGDRCRLILPIVQVAIWIQGLLLM